MIMVSLRSLLAETLALPAALAAALLLSSPLPASAQAQGFYEDYDDQAYDPEADDADEYEDGQEVPDVSYFYDELEDEGDWVEHSNYGTVFRPRGVDRDWRPYTRGHWANTEEYGWYWMSDEPFGWATYHYGRWHLDPRYGWVWVPGTRWAPAWVAWRSNDDYIGWAPLPPDSYWEPRRGLQYSTAIYESPSFHVYWSFIQPAYITTPVVYRHFVPFERTRTIIINTRPQTNYVFVNRRIVNRGISVTTIERVTRTRITKVRVTTTTNVTYRRNVNRSGTVINVYRPKLTHYNIKRDRKPGRPVIVRKQWHDVDHHKKPIPVRKKVVKPNQGPQVPAPYRSSPSAGQANKWSNPSGQPGNAGRKNKAQQDRQKIKQQRALQNRQQNPNQLQNQKRKKPQNQQGQQGQRNKQNQQGQNQQGQNKKKNKNNKDCVPPYCN